MSSYVTLWAGVGLRALLCHFCGDSERIVGAITGVWDGVAFHGALEDKTISDLPMLLLLIVCACYDVASSRSAAQLMIFITGSIVGFFLAGVFVSFPVEVSNTYEGDIRFAFVDTLGEGSLTVAPPPTRRLDRRRSTGSGGVSNRNRAKTPISRMTLTPLPTTSSTITRVRGGHLPLSQLDSSTHGDVLLSSSAPEQDGETTPRATQLGLHSPELNESSIQSYPTTPSQLGSSKPPSTVSGANSAPAAHQPEGIYYVVSPSASGVGAGPRENVFPHSSTVPLPSLTPSPMALRESRFLDAGLLLPESHMGIMPQEEFVQGSSSHRGRSGERGMGGSDYTQIRVPSVAQSLTSGIYHPARVPLPETVYSSSRSSSPKHERSRAVTPEPEGEFTLVPAPIEQQDDEEIAFATETTPKATVIDLEELALDPPKHEHELELTLVPAPIEQLAFAAKTTPKATVIDLEELALDPPEHELELDMNPGPSNGPPEPSVISNDTAMDSYIPDGPRGLVLTRAEELRQQAKDAEVRREGLIRRRKMALDESRYTEAFALKCDIENLDEEIKRLHRRAERRFHEAHNKSKRSDTLDVHGLKPREACRQVEKALHTVLQRNGKHLQVIVGRGKHSMGGKPILKAAITKLMTDEHHLQVVHDKFNPGVLHIYL